MKRLGQNQGGYRGERIEIAGIVRRILDTAHARGWAISQLEARAGVCLPVLTRPPQSRGSWAPRFYLSAGIHGDEPAGPLAMLDLIERDELPRDAWFWCCPCLNPTGFPRNTRESEEGIDLNRDYRQLRSAEVQRHVAWLEHLPLFDLTLCLHEDWEASGFYVYEVNPDHHPSLAEAMVEAVRGICPIDLAAEIDGREASGGIIRPNIDPALRSEWPEALYLINHKTRLSYTVEAPSDFELSTRVAALAAGVKAAISGFPRERCQQPSDNPSAPDPR